MSKQTGTALEQPTAASEDEEEQELAEPPFKYVRILNGTSAIFAGDSVSCMAVNSKFLLLGAHSGCLYVLDHSGNLVGGNRRIQPHTVAVNQLSLDLTGEFVASCANDGRVAVYGLCDGQFGVLLSTNRPVRSVAIDPEYAKFASARRFVTGDRNLTVHERGFLSRHKQADVFVGKERDGFVHAVSWKGSLIAFANDSGVRVYDKASEMMITHVERRHDPTLTCDLFPARLRWLDERTLAIGWANTVTVCAVKHVPGVAPDFRTKMVEIRYLWEVPHWCVAGLAFAPAAAGEQQSEEGWQELVLFCVNWAKEQPAPTDDEQPEQSPFPRVLLAEPATFNQFLVATEDIIEMRDADKLHCANFHLEPVEEDEMYYLLCSKDLIQVRPSNDDDHLEWLLANKHFERALQFAQERGERLRKSDAQKVAQQYLQHLLAERRYEEAAALSVQVCGRQKEQWERQVDLFQQHGQLLRLAPRLPTHDPQLDPECYQDVLMELLEQDAAGFRRYVADWPPDLYRLGAVIRSTLDRLYTPGGEAEQRTLLGALAQLYTYERDYERALAIYLKLEDRAVFGLIGRFQLFELARDKIQTLMTIDTEQAVRLLLEHEDRLPANLVMTQLSRQPRLQLAYLDRLFARGEGAEFADLAVSLYAEYDRARLQPFLLRCEHYRLEKALQVCQQRRLLAETVFLLGRGGNLQEALRVIIAESRDIDQAVDFCKEHDDADLWNSLIDYGLQRPEFVATLMRRIGTHVDPAVLLRKLPPRTAVPRLRESLAKLLDDHALQTELQDGCCRVTLADCHQNLQRLYRMQKRGTRVDPAIQTCVLCRELLCRDRGLELAAFPCRHVFHAKCLLEHGVACCVTCNSTA